MRSLYAVFSLALIGALAFTTSVRAQAPAAALATPTVALVDIQRVVAESAAGKAVQAQLDGELRKFRDEMTKREEHLKVGENELQRQRAILQQDALNKLVQDLQREQADGQRYAQERQDALNKARNDAVNVVLDNVKDITQQMATERHITLVLNKQIVLVYLDKNFDITDDVIQRLNTKLPSVAVTVPAPGAAPAPAAPGAAPAASPAKAPAKK